jgi:hypothetical protein
MVTFGPGTRVTSSVAPFSDLTTCPAAIIALVTPPGAMPSVMSPFDPPPVSPGPAITERIAPKRNAISNPVAPADDNIDPARTTRPVPPAWIASTLPWTMVAGSRPPRPTRRCSYAPRLNVRVNATVPLASRTRSVTDAGLPDDSTRNTLYRYSPP